MISRRIPYLLGLILAALLAAILLPQRMVTGLPAAGGATVSTPVWVLLMLVIAVTLGAFLRPAMPELEATSSGNPERVALRAMGTAAVLVAAIVGGAGISNPAVPASCMIRALTWWVCLTLVGRWTAPRGAWILPLGVALTLLWFGFAASGPKAWAIPFRVDQAPETWAATLGVVAVGVIAARAYVLSRITG